MPEKKETLPPEKFKVRKVKEDEKLPFTVHLAELRQRLIYAVAAILVGFVACYSFVGVFIELLEKPLKSNLPNIKLTFLYPTEGFFVSMKVAFFAGFALAYPLVVYQAWLFVSPGLVKKERRLALPLVFLATFFFILGISFNYFIILPFGLKFLITYGQEYWLANIAVDYYLSFCVKLTLAFGLVFQLPIIIAVLAKLDFVNSDQLIKGRGYSVVIAFVIAAILTPPDVITQCLMAGPLVILYELSIHVVKFMEKKNVQAEESVTKAEDTKSA